MYTSTNFKTKKALKDAVSSGQRVTVFQPNDMFGGSPPQEGEVSVEGPHSPKPHAWYARVTLKNGVVVKVI